MKKEILKIVFVLLSSVFLCVPEVTAQSDTDIEVTGFAIPRNRYVPVSPTGGSPDPWFYTDVIGGMLKNPVNFGQDGIVECSVNFITPFVDVVLPGSLVGNNGELKADIFFGGLSEHTPLIEEEAQELKKFIYAGGIVYVSGAPYGLNLDGSEYDALFQELEIEDRISGNINASNILVQSSMPLNTTPLTNGPFGIIESLRYSSYRSLISSSMTGIVTGLYSPEYILMEGKFGKGYLVVSGLPLYLNGYITDPDNFKYYMNMFAMGCKADQPTVLDVPSFKQGLTPYDDMNPSWENMIYDTGNKQNLWCGETIGQCGCAMTSASMILSYYGVENGPDNKLVNPEYVNNYFSRGAKPILDYYSSWGYTYGNFHWGRVDDYSVLANKKYPDQPKLDQPIIENFDADKLKGYIDDEIPVILKVIRSGGGIHWVVVKGYDGDDFVINDPANPDPTEPDTATLTDYNYTPHAARSMIHYIEANSDFSSLEIFTPSPVQFLVTDPDGNQNLDYYFDESYATDVYSLNIHKPKSGEYKIKIFPANNQCGFTIYSSDTEANSNYYVFENEGVNCEESEYVFSYNPDDSNSLVQKVSMDIKPNDDENILHAKSRSWIQVGILSSLTFDATKINKDTLRFGETGDEKSLKRCLKKGKDINDDNLDDLWCFFDARKTKFNKNSTEGTLTGETVDGMPFTAKDFVFVK